MLKQDWEMFVGHNIRNDTYQFLERMIQGEKYEEIYEDLNKNREKYYLKSNYPLTKYETVAKILSDYQVKVNKETLWIKEDISQNKKMESKFQMKF